MIRDGVPYTIENGWEDSKLLESRPYEEKMLIKTWIHENILPRKSVNKYHTSYGLKHILQNDTGIYMTNNEFKDAMMKCGFYPVNENDLNWEYRISEKSPAFKKI